MADGPPACPNSRGRLFAVTAGTAVFRFGGDLFHRLSEIGAQPHLPRDRGGRVALLRVAQLDDEAAEGLDGAVEDGRPGEGLVGTMPIRFVDKASLRIAQRFIAGFAV